MEGAGFVLDKEIAVHSNGWLVMVFQKDKEYYKFELTLKPRYMLHQSENIESELSVHKKYPPRNTNAINASLKICDFEVDDFVIIDELVELENTKLETVQKLVISSCSNKKIVVDFRTESPAGYTLFVING